MEVHHVGSFTAASPQPPQEALAAKEGEDPAFGRADRSPRGRRSLGTLDLDSLRLAASPSRKWDEDLVGGNTRQGQRAGPRARPRPRGHRAASRRRLAQQPRLRPKPGPEPTPPRRRPRRYEDRPENTPTVFVSTRTQIGRAHV